MRSADDGERPRKAPAVAVEHRQRPQIDGMLLHRRRDDVALGEQVGAAMMIDDALGISGRARGVVERDGVPLVLGHGPGIGRIAAGQELLIVDPVERLAGDLELALVEGHEKRASPGEQRQGRLDDRGEFAIHDQGLGVGVIEGEGDDGGIETRVEGVEHAAGHRHAVMRLEHRRRVGKQDRHRIAAADAAIGEGRGKPARPGIELGIGKAKAAMNDGTPVGIDRRRAREERQRRQRLEVGRGLGQVPVVGVDRHGAPL